MSAVGKGLDTSCEHFVVYRKRDDGKVEFMGDPKDGFWEHEAYIFSSLDEAMDAYLGHLEACNMKSDESMRVMPFDPKGFPLTYPKRYLEQFIAVRRGANHWDAATKLGRMEQKKD